MKKSRFTETQIVSILKQADAGVPVKDICRQAGISVLTYYQWKSKYGGMEASDLKRVKDLEAENARPKRMYAEMALDNATMKELIAKNCRPEQKREAVQDLVEVHARPLRRSCECVDLSRAAWYRPPLDWTVRDAELIAALAGLVEDRPARCDDVREAAWWWMLEYNEQRPNDSLGDLTPAEYRQPVAESSNFDVSA